MVTREGLRLKEFRRRGGERLTGGSAGGSRLLLAREQTCEAARRGEGGFGCSPHYSWERARRAGERVSQAGGGVAATHLERRRGSASAGQWDRAPPGRVSRLTAVGQAGAGAGADSPDKSRKRRDASCSSVCCSLESADPSNWSPPCSRDTRAQAASGFRSFCCAGLVRFGQINHQRDGGESETARERAWGGRVAVIQEKQTCGVEDPREFSGFRVRGNNPQTTRPARPKEAIFWKSARSCDGFDRLHAARTPSLYLLSRKRCTRRSTRNACLEQQ